MTFNASIERLSDTQEIVNIGLVGFDYDKVAENYQATEICTTPIGRQYDVLNHLLDNNVDDFDFRIPYKALINAEGASSPKGNADSISTYGPQQLVGSRKIVAGIVSINFLGTNPIAEPITGIQKILIELSSPLESRWIDENIPEQMPEFEYCWEDLPCTVEELENGLSVLRFNFRGGTDTNGHDVLYDLDSFTELALAETKVLY